MSEPQLDETIWLGNDRPHLCHRRNPGAGRGRRAKKDEDFDDEEDDEEDDE